MLPKSGTAHSEVDRSLGYFQRPYSSSYLLENARKPRRGSSPESPISRNKSRINPAKGAGAFWEIGRPGDLLLLLQATWLFTFWPVGAFGGIALVGRVGLARVRSSSLWDSNRRS
jgi:hypothetical protein